MADLTVEDLKQRLLSLDLLDMGKIRDVENSFGTQNFTPAQFLQSLQRFGYLTKYQAERLQSGESGGFYYGDYRIQYMVGSGSFARVFRCVHKSSGKVVAVKVLRSRFRDDKTAIEEFEREAELGHELRHPNIAAVYEWSSTKYDHYMVMDFIEGRTLRQEVDAQKNGRVEPKRATRIVTDVCSALDYAMKRGYQHRDMKLSNIMLSSSGKAVLLDFGLLADENSDAKTQRAIEYAALERTTRVRRDDKRSDLYFLGGIYYQLLTGIAPLGEIKERAKRLDSSRFKNVKPIREVAPYVPRVVAFIVDKAMKLDPAERYQSPGAMLADLEIAAKKLESGAVDEEIKEGSLAQAHKKSAQNLPTVLIVEANPDLQNTFRQAFKNAGFRVLILSDASRALERLEEPESAICAVMFNAQSLGSNAVVGFNQMAESPLTKDIPAVLLLDENQVKWAAKAKRSKTRLAVGMPITMKRLILVVMKLAFPERFEKPGDGTGTSAGTKANVEKTPSSAKTNATASEKTASSSGTSAVASEKASEETPQKSGADANDAPPQTVRFSIDFDSPDAADVAAEKAADEAAKNADPLDDFPVEQYADAIDRAFDAFDVTPRQNLRSTEPELQVVEPEGKAPSVETPVDAANGDDDYCDYVDDEDAQDGENSETAENKK